MPTIVLSQLDPVSTPEGAPAEVLGTFDDTNGNAATSFAASVGTVTKSADDGTFTWRHNPTTEVTDQTVTITATNSFGDSTTTEFLFTALDAALRSTLTPTILSVTSSGHFENAVGERAFDGDPTTEWNAGDYSGTVTVHFDGEQTFLGVVLLVQPPSSSDQLYYISGSNDGVTFTNIVAKFRYSAQDSVNVLEPILFPPPSDPDPDPQQGNQPPDDGPAPPAPGSPAPVTYEYLRITVNGQDSLVSISEVRLLAPTNQMTPPDAQVGVPLTDVPVFYFTDDNPAADIDDYTATVELGDGNTVTLTSTPGANGHIAANPVGGFNVLLTHTYAATLEDVTFSVSVVDVTSTLMASTSTFSVNAPANQYAPVFASAAGFNVAENTTAVGTATATDADVLAQTVTFSITGGADAARFGITSGGVLTFNSAPDHESPTDVGANNVYDVIITADDGHGLNTIQAIAVTVTNVNESPTITSGVGSISVAENSTTVTTITATDPDASTTLSYSLSGTDTAKFNISSSGVITFKAAPNFEVDATSYRFDVTVSDGSLTDTETVNVTVTNVNDNTPVITSATSFNVAENTTAVGTVTATDADLPTQAVTFSITSGADAARFSITSGGVLTFKSAPNYESPTDVGANNVYNVSVTASDGNGRTTTQDIAVTVTPTNDNAPVFTSAANFNVAENTTAIGTVTVTDADRPAQAVAFSITSGADAARFSITSGGVLTFKSAPDYENPTDVGTNNVYNVSVTANDGNGRTTTQAIAVTVTPVDEVSIVVIGALKFATSGAFALSGGVYSTTSPVSVGFTTDSSVPLLNLTGTTTINTTAGTIGSTGLLSSSITSSSITLSNTGLPNGTSIANLTGSGVTVNNPTPFAVAGNNFTHSSFKLVETAGNPQLHFQGVLTLPVGLQLPVNGSNFVVMDSAGTSLPTMSVAASGTFTVAGISIPVANLTLIYAPARGTFNSFRITGEATISVPGVDSAFDVTVEGVIVGSAIESLLLNLQLDNPLTLAGVSVNPQNLQLQYLSADNTLAFNGQAVVSVAGMSRTSGTGDKAFTLTANGTISNGALSDFSLVATATNLANGIANFKVAGMTIVPQSMSLTYVVEDQELRIAANTQIRIGGMKASSGSSNALLTLSAAGTIVSGSLTEFTLTGDTSAVKIANVIVDPNNLLLSYVQAQNQFNLSGEAVVTIGGWRNPNNSNNALLALNAAGTIISGSLTEFTLTGDTSAVKIANVTVDPSNLQLSYDSAESEFNVSGEAVVTVGTLGGSFNVTAAGTIANNTTESLSLTIVTDASLSVAGVTIEPENLSLNYSSSSSSSSSSGSRFGIAGKANISAPDLGLDEILIDVSGQLSPVGTLDSLAMSLQGSVELAVSGTTVRLTDPSFTFVNNYLEQTFQISGSAAVQIGDVDISVTMGDSTHPGLVIARNSSNTTTLKSAYLKDGNASLFVGALELQAKNFLFQFDASAGSLTVGGSVTAKSGDRTFVNLTLPPTQITGGSLGSVNIPIPDLAFTVADIGSMRFTDAELYAEAALPPKFGLSGLATINFLDTSFTADVAALEFTVFPGSTIPVMTYADISLNGNFGLGQLRPDEYLIEVTATELNLKYDNPTGILLPSGSLTGSVSVEMNLPGFDRGSNLSVVLNGDGIVIQDGDVVSADFTLNGELSYGLLTYTLEDVNVEYTPDRLSIEGSGGVEFFGLGEMEVQLGSPATSDTTIPAQTIVVGAGGNNPLANYYHAPSNASYPRYRVATGSRFVRGQVVFDYEYRVDIPSYVQRGAPATSGIVIEYGALKSLDFRATGNITVAGVTLAEAEISVAYSNNEFRASGSMSSTLGSVASLNLTMGTVDRPGLVISKEGVISRLKLSGTGEVTIASMRVAEANVDIDYSTSNGLPTLLVSGYASTNFFNLAELNLTLGNGTTPGLSISNGVIDSFYATADATFGKHGITVSGSLTLQYSRNFRGVNKVTASGTVVGSLPGFGSTTMDAELVFIDASLQSFTLTADKEFNFRGMVKLDGTIQFNYLSGEFSASGNLNIKIFDNSISAVGYAISIQEGGIHSFSLTINQRLIFLGATFDINASASYNDGTGAITITGSAGIRTPDTKVWPRTIRNTDFGTVSTKLYLIPNNPGESYIQGWGNVDGVNLGGTAYFDGRAVLGVGDPIGIDLDPFPQIESIEDAARAYVAASNGYVHEDDVNVSNEQFQAYLYKEKVAEEQTQQLIQSGISDVSSGPAVSITDVVKQGVGENTPEFFEFAVNLKDAPSDTPVTVAYATEDVTAIADNGDYTPVSGTLTWLPGETGSKIIRVQAHPRMVADPHKLFVVRLSDPQNAAIASSVGVGDILYSNFASTTSLALSNPNALFGEPVSYTATVSHGGAGYVRFYDNGELLTFVPTVDGVATYTPFEVSSGDHNITAEFTGWQIPGYSFLPSESSAMLQIVRAASQSLTFDPLTDTTYGADEIPLFATSTSGLEVTYRVVSGPATVTNDVLTTTGIGEIVVEAMQSGDGNYSAATPVQQSFEVYPAVLTYTVEHQTISLGQTLADVTGTYIGFVNGEDASVLIAPPELKLDRPLEGVGFYELSASGAAAANYVIYYNPGTLAVTQIASVVNLDAAASNSVYGETVTLRASVGGGLGGYAPTGTVTFFDGGYRLGSAPLVEGVAEFAWIEGSAGTHSIQAVFNGDDNFKRGTSASQSFAITKSASLVSLTSEAGVVGSEDAFTVTATVSSATSGGLPPTGFVEFRNGSTVISTESLLSGTAILTVPAGTTANLTAVYLGDENFVGSSARLNQASNLESAVVLATTGTLASGLPTTIVATVTSPEPETPNGTVQFFKGATLLATVALENGTASDSSLLGLGTHSITAVYSGDHHFAGSTSTFDITIVLLAPAVRVQAPGGIYNGDTFSATASIIGPDGVATDNLEGGGLSITYQQLNASGNVVHDLGTTQPVNSGRYRATATFTGSENYAPIVASETFTITPATLTIRVHDASSLSTQPTPEFSGTVAGLIDGETVTVTYFTHANGGSPVGRYSITATATGDSAKNYTVSVVPGTLSIVQFYQSGSDLIVGGTPGRDTIRIRNFGTSVRVLLNGASLGNFSSTGTVRVYGGAGDDTLTVDRDVITATELFGENGNDKIQGGLGNDTLHGGAGNDFLTSTTGNDVLLGGDGNDTLRAGFRNDHLEGGGGNDLLIAGSGDDVLLGGDGHDTLQAGSGHDHLDGEAGNDTLNGEAGDDILVGGDGDDRQKGGDGKDILIGGLGADSLTGNSGDDVFIGSSTLVDTNIATLRRARNIWSGNGSYLNRVALLQEIFNANATVDDDNATDTLAGSNGTDLFFANLHGTGLLDLFSDRDKKELVIDLD